MSVLITGGVSEFGNHLIEALLNSGESLLVLHNGNGEKVSNLGNAHVTLKHMSSTDEEGIKNLINEHNVKVVYDVSLTTSAAHKGPLQAAQTLILGITAVLDAIRNASNPPSLVLVSGEQVYGSSTLRDETQPLTPTTFFGAAQMSVEAMVHSYGVSYRIPIAIGRVPDVLVSSKKDLEQKLEKFSNDSFVNILSFSKATEAILALSKLAESDPPAEVFNISNSNDFRVGDLSATRPSSFTSVKLDNATGWKSVGIENLPESFDLEVSEIPPVFLIFGADSEAKKELLKMAKGDGVVAKESSIKNLQEASDADVWKEFYSIHPSHLIYFSNETENFEGDCFTLRTNMATNLYFPWLLASIAEKTSAHFTHFGDNVAREETSALAVKGFTQKMLGQFENTLRLGDTIDKSAMTLIKEKKTGGSNNNV